MVRYFAAAADFIADGGDLTPLAELDPDAMAQDAETKRLLQLAQANINDPEWLGLVAKAKAGANGLAQAFSTMMLC
ncbi:hypothetical protein [Sphingosinicella sp. BN140058]|uniref:hypothetical protein n=1 Tax=Sphingosinicella sp. BN140058 TaxID=1892855 RepID=UPI0013ED0398|nr:hypothetical protein [Sphingosinicella sp. BN140058]